MTERREPQQQSIQQRDQVVAFQLSKPHQLLALGFGSGLIKPAPGTWGTLAAVPFYFLMTLMPQWGYLVVTVLVCVTGIWFCGRTAKDVGVHDHSAIVWDEFAGFFITMALVEPSLLNIAVGFALFRFFDIVKPWPIRWLDKKVHGGIGIMLDDIVAGIFAFVALQLFVHYV